MDIVTTAKGIQVAISAANAVRQLVARWQNGKKPPEEEIRQAEQGLSEIVGRLATLTGELALLQANNLELQDRVAKLERAQDIDAKRELAFGKYYVKDGPPGFAEGPYCVACWANTKHVPLSLLVNTIGTHYFKCPGCEATYSGEGLDD